MKEEIERKVETLMRELLAGTYKKGYNWKGYEVYEPIYVTRMCTGLPLVVFVKGEEVRLSTDDESLEYLDFCIKNEENKTQKAKELQNKFEN